MSLLFDPLFSSIALGHMAVDLLNGSRPVVLAYLSGPLGLTNTNIALISTLYVWMSSLAQPVFGWLTDRFGPRWFAAGGLLWMMVFYLLAITLPGKAALASIVIASLGSAALHPAGAMQATLRGRTHYYGRETTAASYFFMFGQMGFFFGPVITGPLLGAFGLYGLLIPAGICLPIALNVGWQLRKTRPIANSDTKISISFQYNKKFIITLTIVAVLQAWAQQNMMTFIPKYLKDLGQTPAVYGLVAGLFMGGSALGNVLGGYLADRIGKIRVIGIMLALASIPLYLISQVGWSHSLYLLVPLSGLLTGSVHSIVVVIAQGMIRGGMALASGLILGTMFSSGALGTLLIGPLADSQGLPLVFQISAGLVLIASFFTWQLRLPENQSNELAV
ncbi:MAG: MFS transporter [Anaerolineae bacterium]|nr:MFS transporter [Anaerolineae bacterium]MDK1119509.1 MFS transporter [Anaerolineae bacterium]